MCAAAGGSGCPAAVGRSKAWMLLTQCFWTWLKAAGLMDTMQGVLGCLLSIHREFGPSTAMPEPLVQLPALHVALCLASPCSPHWLWARDVTSSAPEPVVAQGGSSCAAGPAWSRCWIPWLAPHGQDHHHLETGSIPNPSIPHLVPPSLVGLIPRWTLHTYQLFPGRSLWAHTDLGSPGFDHAPAPQMAQHLTAALVCPGAAPTLLPGHSTQDTHPVCPARGTTLKTPTLPLLPGHCTLMHPPCPSCFQGSFGVYYGAAPREQALIPLGQACADPSTGSG